MCKGGNIGAAVPPQVSHLNRMDDCGEQLKHRVEITFPLSLSFSALEDFNSRLTARNVTIHKTYTAHYLGSVFSFFSPAFVTKHGNYVCYDPLKKGKTQYTLIKTVFNYLFYHIIIYHSIKRKRKQCYETPV